MLKKKQRLTATQFDRFFLSGRRRHSTAFTLVWHAYPTFHCAAVVGKKVRKKAVDRNRLRRQLYNIVYRLMQGTDCSGVYIIIAKPAAASLSFAAMKEEVAGLLRTTR